MEETTKKLNLQEVGVNLDATAEQTNVECQEDINELHPDYLHLDIDNVQDMDDSAQKLHNIYRKIDIPNIKELKAMTCQLDPFQRNVVDIGVKFAKDIIKSQREGNSKAEPPHTMVHGGAGAGKTFVIKTLAQWVQYLLQKSVMTSIHHTS